MAQMCQERVASLSQAGLPLLFMGDFNIDPARDEYKWLTGHGWRDAYEVVPAADSNHGDIATFWDGRRIDHVLYYGDALKPWQWLRLTSPDPKRRLSDHDPVLARFWLSTA
jgi:endonuclease/exonuclease/phosphatase family metal-dependent hydrolase